MDAAAAGHQFTLETPIRISVGHHIFQSNYRILQSAFAAAGAQLTNQVFLLIYGDFEAFLIDLVSDALQEQGITDPFQETFNLLAITRWHGKLDRIAQRFSLNLGNQLFLETYKDLEMTFLGKTTVDPIDFLQAMADLRNRLVHSAGRADQKLIREYPESGLEEGQLIELPFGIPTDIHFFFIPLTDILDEAFYSVFGWAREVTCLDSLVDNDLRIDLSTNA